MRLKFLQLIQKDLEKIETSKRAYKIHFLNQSYIFHLVAMWQVFIEEQVTWGLEEMMRLSPVGVFEPLLRSRIGRVLDRFNTPNRKNIDTVFYEVMGIRRISDAWSWENMRLDTAKGRLTRILNKRHDIAHQSKTMDSLSYEENFEDMKHIFNLAYLIDYEVRKHLAALSGDAFNEPIILPFPQIIRDQRNAGTRGFG